MDEDCDAQGRSTLWLALKQLAGGRGLQRRDLLEALAGDLNELQQCWGINLRNGLDAARLTVDANLKAHVFRIKPPRRGPRSELSHAEHGQRYRRCIYASFNILNDPVLLMTTEIGQRRAWLADPARGKGRLHERDSKRYLNHAIDQIEQQIRASGYEPVAYDSGAAEVPPILVPLEAAEQTSQTAFHPPYRTIILGVAALGIVTTAIIAAMFQHGNSASPPRAAAPSPLLNPTQPILIQTISKLDPGPNDTTVSPGSIQLTSAQLTDGTFLNNLWSKQTIPTDLGAVDVTFKSNTNEPVTITGIEVIKKCQAPLNGTIFYGPPAGEGNNEGIGFNLDSPVTYAQDWSNGSFSGQYFIEHHISVAPTEPPQTMSLHVVTGAHYCTFTFQMDIASSATVNQTPIVEMITDHGNPFAISATFDNGSMTQVDFSKYEDAYITGMAAKPTVGGYVQVNPKTYPGGAANPLLYPPTR